MTLLPYCTDNILCILTPGTPSVHKNGSLPFALLWCKWNWECPCLWQKTHDRNGLSRSHLHHNGRRGVDHVYFVMPNQQYNQLQNVPIVRIIFDSPTYSTRKWHAEHRGSGLLLFLTMVVLRFSKTLEPPQILGTRRIIWSKFHTDYP